MELTGFEPTDSRSEYATPSLRKMRSKRPDQVVLQALGDLWGRCERAT